MKERTRAQRRADKDLAKAKAKAWFKRHGYQKLLGDPRTIGIKAKHPKCDCWMCKMGKQEIQARRRVTVRIDWYLATVN